MNILVNMNTVLHDQTGRHEQLGHLEQTGLHEHTGQDEQTVRHTNRLFDVNRPVRMNSRVAATVSHRVRVLRLFFMKVVSTFRFSVFACNTVVMHVFGTILYGSRTAAVRASVREAGAVAADVSCILWLAVEREFKRWGADAPRTF